MRLPLPLVSFALAGFVVSKSIVYSNTEKQSLLHGQEDSLHVPGDSPMMFCTESDENLLEIEHVDLTPNPPKAGTTLTIEASGVFKEDIQPGAKVHLQVKYRKYIKLVDTEADLCDQMANVDLKCPLKKGHTVITKDVDLPSKIPPGDYDVTADVYTEDGRKITCLTAQVKFGESTLF
ncbi:MAG: Phosphatidylglycerol/phosphatidylinositol transfer protein [Sclerophora amabilis]|nr:MAG: Phosphatidylglycerol/phosphatidylinositol transfer protein [Sclerophora amabilis]